LLSHRDVTKKILIIEDHADIRRVLSMTLQHLGYETVEANNGRSGIDLTLRERPDLVLLDLSLPDVSGFEMAKTIKKDPRTAEIPVVGLSAYAEQDTASRALAAGMADYLVKPADSQKLAAVIKKLIEIHPTQ
jgi:CheY-like chemotaxis protein